MNNKRRTSDDFFKEVINRVESEPDFEAVSKQQHAWVEREKEASSVGNDIDAGKRAIQNKLRWGKR